MAYGTNVSFVCSVNDTNVAITWNTSAVYSEILNSTLQVEIKDNLTTSILRLTNVTLSHTGEYSCVASSSNDAHSSGSGSGSDYNVDVATATLNVIG